MSEGALYSVGCRQGYDGCIVLGIVSILVPCDDGWEGGEGVVATQCSVCGPVFSVLLADLVGPPQNSKRVSQPPFCCFAAPWFARHAVTLHAHTSLTDLLVEDWGGMQVVQW